jgi:hypothetical protein
LSAGVSRINRPFLPENHPETRVWKQRARKMIVSIQQLVKKYPGVRVQGASDLDELDHVDSAFAGLHTSNEGMRTLESCRQGSLGKFSPLASSDENGD